MHCNVERNHGSVTIRCAVGGMGGGVCEPARVAGGNVKLVGGYIRQEVPGSCRYRRTRGIRCQ